MAFSTAVVYHLKASICGVSSGNTVQEFYASRANLTNIIALKLLALLGTAMSLAVGLARHEKRILNHTLVTILGEERS